LSDGAAIRGHVGGVGGMGCRDMVESYGPDLARRVLSGERRALAQAITLVESSRTDHREMALSLLEQLTPPRREAMRIGLSGAPGVGKSTFVEALGIMLAEAGLRVAVLAVDPSSVRSGGSILGDKTRMERLSRNPKAFIRPSPSQTRLGGVARHTYEATALCEAAGFDTVLIETVGVGQSETLVAEMSDLFVLLIAPAGGDELQGIKRGIMEIADLILVNKADGNLKRSAMGTCAEYAQALRHLRSRQQDPEGFPKAMIVSALNGEGLPEVWSQIRALDEWRRRHGHRRQRRAAQARRWFENEIHRGLVERITTDRAVRQRMTDLGDLVAEGKLFPVNAAEELLRRIPAK